MHKQYFGQKKCQKMMYKYIQLIKNLLISLFCKIINLTQITKKK